MSNVFSLCEKLDPNRSCVPNSRFFLGFVTSSVASRLVFFFLFWQVLLLFFQIQICDLQLFEDSLPCRGQMPLPQTWLSSSTQALLLSLLFSSIALCWTLWRPQPCLVDPTTKFQVALAWSPSVFHREVQNLPLSFQRVRPSQGHVSGST